MLYRRATIWDAEIITKLWDSMHDEVDVNKAIREEYNNTESMFIHMVTRIKLDNWVVLVAEDDGKVVGFIMGFVRYPDYNPCHIIGTCEAMYVAPEYRHKGVHAELTDTIIEEARKKGATQFELIGTYSPSLIKFWDHMGFEPVQTVYRYKEDNHGREKL